MTAPVIRSLTLPEVETLVSWAAAEGWNPGTADAAAFHAADPDGFLGALVGDQMAAGISAVAYGSTFGFIGLYIAQPAWRGRGLGRAVWDAGMARLGGRTIGLDGVPEQQANYRSMGFATAYETVRFSGRPALGSAVAASELANTGALAALDEQCFPAPRPGFLSAWLGPPRIVRAVIGTAGLRGYGIIRPAVEGYKVGPLFAESDAVAVELFAALVDAVPGEVHIDVPLTQSGFVAALEGAGMTAGFATARMYRGPAPAIDMTRVFGITTLELG